MLRIAVACVSSITRPGSASKLHDPRGTSSTSGRACSRDEGCHGCATVWSVVVVTPYMVCFLFVGQGSVVRSCWCWRFCDAVVLFAQFRVVRRQTLATCILRAIACRMDFASIQAFIPSIGRGTDLVQVRRSPLAIRTISTTVTPGHPRGNQYEFSSLRTGETAGGESYRPAKRVAIVSGWPQDAGCDRFRTMLYREPPPRRPSRNASHR